MDDAAAASSACEHLQRALTWPAQCTGTSVPQQHNGCDCGIFMIAFLECASVGRCVAPACLSLLTLPLTLLGALLPCCRPMDFSQADIPFQRRRLLTHILNGSIP
jgi:Ulp1 family protease